MNKTLEQGCKTYGAKGKKEGKIHVNYDAEFPKGHRLQLWVKANKGMRNWAHFTCQHTEVLPFYQCAENHLDCYLLYEMHEWKKRMTKITSSRHWTYLLIESDIFSFFFFVPMIDRWIFGVLIITMQISHKIDWTRHRLQMHESLADTWEILQ